ncbi:MAG: EamA family transporter [Clostridiales bacterium]|nr:EamA family transporter [Candidatus Crickella merdequi]
MERNKARIQLLIICLLFGTIGTFTRFIDMPSSVICFGRAFLAVITIIIVLMMKKQKVDWQAIRSNFILIAATGVCMCVNWVCQFEAFKYTTIATATLCYYIQPMFFIIMATIVYREKLSLKKIICILTAFTGMVLVSGVLKVGFNLSELKGVIYAVVGAFFYAVILVLTKSFKDVSTLDSTLVQLTITTVVMLPYIMLTEDLGSLHITAQGIICLMILGIVHTGIAYSIYFRTVQNLDAQTVGIISYVDPVVAVMLSAFLLKEPLTLVIIIGAVLILGATAVSELTGDK